MRDVVLALGPLATVLYFLVNQHRFVELMAWVETFVRCARQESQSVLGSELLSASVTGCWP